MRKLSIILFISLLILNLLNCKTQPPQPSIKIIDPEFTVITIYIIQADLVVTEFEAIIKIDNPNDFAIELSSIKYELYGNGRIWASGTGKNLRSSDTAIKTTNEIFQIPANSKNEARFFFKMNFIDMSRDLLDDVIKMNKVNYKFIGEAEIQPVLNGVLPFKSGFECSGLSEVRKK